MCGSIIPQLKNCYMMKKYINKLLLVVLTAFLLFFWECSKDKWDQHYNETAGQNDLLNGLRQQGYNAFADALAKINLSDVINSGMSFTIFAVPDDAFKQAAANLSDDDLKFLVLNHILAGKRYSSSFNDTIYRALGGDVLHIWMNLDMVTNYYKEPTTIISKDIDIPNAVVFGLAKSIIIYPTLNYHLSADYPFFSDLYKSCFVPDFSIRYSAILGLSSAGLSVDTVYRYQNIFVLNNYSRKNNITFIVSKDSYAVPAYNNLVSGFLPYFKGDEDFIKNNFAVNTRLKHVISGSVYNSAKDSLIVNNLFGDRLEFPVSKVKTEIMDNGNKLLVIDTMLYSYSLVEIKNVPLLFYSDSARGDLTYKNIRTSGNFNKVVKGVVTWKTAPLPGDYIEYTIPADSIYSSVYNLYLQYVYKSSYVQVKIYFDGDSLQNRFDLSSIIGATPKPPYYQINIASGFSIKQYSTHTIRLEVTATKGSATEIMSLGYLVLKLQ